MTRIGLINNLLILFCISVLCNRVLAQPTSFAPLVDGHYLDFITTPSDQTILLTTQGSYILNEKEAMQAASLGTLRLMERLQSNNSPTAFFPLDNGSMAQLTREGKLEVNKKYLDPAIYLRYENGDNWKVTDKIWYRSKEDVNFAFKLFEEHNPEETRYTDGVVYQQVVWLATADQGIVRIEQPKGDSRFRVRQYYEGNDLLSNECTALCRYGTNSVLVGHYGGLTSVGDFQVDFSDLTVKPVKQIVVDDEIIWCLTQDAIIKVTANGKATAIELPQLELDEDLLRLAVKKDKSLLLLSEESFHVIPYQTYITHTVENARYNEPIQFYQIRSNKYYSDGQAVYGYNSKKQEWEVHSGKKVPNQVVSESDRVTLLFDDGTGTVIAKDSAQVIANLSHTVSDIINVNRVGWKQYHLTEDGFYLKKGKDSFEKLSKVEDRYYKHVTTAAGTEYVFGESGVYNLAEEELTALDWVGKKETYPYSQNQFAYEGKLITFSRSALKVIDLRSQSLQSINLAPLKILDIVEKQDAIWVLTKKSLISIRKNDILMGEKVISSVLPLNQTLEKANLVNGALDNQVYIAGQSQLIEADLDAAISDYASQMHLVYIADKNGKQVVSEEGVITVGMGDLPLTLSYSPNTYGSTSAKYSFHLNHKGKNNSVWKNDGQYEFDVAESGKYTLVAKYVDDIYGSKHITEPSQFYVTKETVIATTSGVSLWHVPLILLTLLLLWSGWWLKGKLTA